MMMKAHKIEENMKDKYENRITRLESAIEHIDKSLFSIHEDLKRNETNRDLKLDTISKEMRLLSDSVQKGFEKVYEKSDKRFEKVEVTIAHIRQESWSQFRWVLGTIFVLVGGILTNIVLKNLHLF